MFVHIIYRNKGNIPSFWKSSYSLNDFPFLGNIHHSRTWLETRNSKYGMNTRQEPDENDQGPQSSLGSTIPIRPFTVTRVDLFHTPRPWTTTTRSRERGNRPSHGFGMNVCLCLRVSITLPEIRGLVQWQVGLFRSSVRFNDWITHYPFIEMCKFRECPTFRSRNETNVPSFKTRVCMSTLSYLKWSD